MSRKKGRGPARVVQTARAHFRGPEAPRLTPGAQAEVARLRAHMVKQAEIMAALAGVERFLRAQLDTGPVAERAGIAVTIAPLGAQIAAFERMWAARKDDLGLPDMPALSIIEETELRLRLQAWVQRTAEG